MTPDTKAALDKARNKASESSHKEVLPLHLAKVLAASHCNEGLILRLAIMQASHGDGNSKLEAFNNALGTMLTQLLQQSSSSSSSGKKGKQQRQRQPLPPHSVSLNNVLGRARLEQNRRGSFDSRLQVAYLVLGLILSADSNISDCLGDKNVGLTADRVAQQLFKLLCALEGGNTQLPNPSSATARPPQCPDPRSAHGFSMLKMYGHDLVAQARAGILKPVIGRNQDIKRVADIICSANNLNNAILVGEAGVGKTAVVEGLAQRIARGDLSRLKGARLISLDMGKLLAGTCMVGELERRLQAVLKEVKETPGTVILFIDEVHTVPGAGMTQQGGMGVANILKPMLARGQLRCIGATTPVEYRRYIERDAAFQRRFEKVEVAELSVKHTTYILRELRDTLERDYCVRIQDCAIVAAAKLSKRYLVDGHLPDKAIVLVKRACGNVRAQLERPPVEMENLEEKMSELKAELRSLMKDMVNKARRDEVKKLLQDVRARLEREKTEHGEKQERIQRHMKLRQEELSKLQWSERLRLPQSILQCGSRWEILIAVNKYRLKKLKKKESHLENQLKNLEASEHEKAVNIKQKQQDTQQKEQDVLKTLKSVRESMKGDEDPVLTAMTVSPEQIAEVVSRQSHIPVTRIGQEEEEWLRGLAGRLEQRVVGQTEAVNAVVDAMLTSRVAPDEERQHPIASFLFLGPTGVGKTELAKALTKELFDHESHIIRIDMSEYHDKYTVSRLFGAPPGYVGYEEGGQLTEKVRRRPYSLILLDEVEKAHEVVFDTLLQVLGDGRLTDGQGRTVNFTHTVIIMTSNLGAEDLLQQNKMMDNNSMERRQHKLVMNKVTKTFRTEFLGRLSKIVMFNPLSGQQLRKVARLQMKQVKARFAEKIMALDVTDAALDFILSLLDDQKYGARDIKNRIEERVATRLSKMLLNKEIDENCTVRINAAPEKDDLDYQVTRSGGLNGSVRSDDDDDEEEDYYFTTDEEKEDDDDYYFTTDEEDHGGSTMDDEEEDKDDGMDEEEDIIPSHG
ncbi:hypothetical protein EJB05_47225, partial [Eragrostis curvula]